MSFIEQIKQIKSVLGKNGTHNSEENTDTGPRERRRNKRSSHRGRSILIIDDSVTVVAALGKILRSANCIVYEAFDAEAGISMARTKRPGLIFLDIVLPRMNGFSALRLMRRDPLTHGIPIIMVSGNEYATEQFYAKRIGADDFMKKPFSRHEIFARMDTLIASGILPSLEERLSDPESALVQESDKSRSMDKPQPDLDAYRRSGSAIVQSDETVGITPLEARSQLASMGLQYFSQEQYFAAVDRGDKLAVDLFIVGGGIKVDL